MYTLAYMVIACVHHQQLQRLFYYYQVLPRKSEEQYLDYHRDS